MIIFIPTRGRIAKQYTRTSLFVDKIPYRVVMVVPECESHHWDCDKFVVPDDYKFPDIRQALVREFWEEDPHHMCMDDDLKFYIRRDPEDWHLLYSTYDEIVEMLKEIEVWVDKYAHGALSPREGNNRVEALTVENTRAMRCHFYNAEVIHKEGLDFRESVCKEDFHMTLSLLELGYKNLVSYRYAQGQISGSNATGGCERYRTMEMMEIEAHKLKALHPKGVKVVQKKTKVAWNGGVRTDVICYWKKSYCIRANERILYRSKNEESN